MHVAQINFLRAPADCSAEALFDRWPSLADIPEAAAASGWRVSVIQLATQQRLLQRHGIDYHFVDLRGLRSSAARGRFLADLVADIGGQVVHVHSLGFAADAFAVAQRLPRVPILIQDHADRPPRWWRRPRWRRWYAAASGIAFTSPALAGPFTREGLFAQRTRLFAIPESSSRFQPGDRHAARAETGLDGDPCVLWVGHLSDGKDPLTVLEGVARAAQRLPGIRLYCAFGRAPLMDAVRHRIDSDPRLQGRVHLLGNQPHARIETLMRAADLFVSGSRAESCGFALLEALACGVTPVVTDIPSFRSLTANVVGELWPCGDAGRLAESLVRAAGIRPSRADVRAFFDATLSFAAVGRQWADAYARLLADRREGRS
ncbi:MAG TPA: glycosyltransferase family 4 protein [Luteibacter sp.]|uniref:glycosyltransferase family 4 protein n=1 Tax=Luteibacter sp. TaxID=1886636 RepID=UPI002B5A1803|nr:glycosyltransferase family 4 protein [Luteibacter sp.]HVI56759.1 glycosyltransferase family 4 protein [Luteibacter sp.]